MVDERKIKKLHDKAVKRMDKSVRNMKRTIESIAKLALRAYGQDDDLSIFPAPDAFDFIVRAMNDSTMKDFITPGVAQAMQKDISAMQADLRGDKPKQKPDQGYA